MSTANFFGTELWQCHGPADGIRDTSADRVHALSARVGARKVHSDGSWLTGPPCWTLLVQVPDAGEAVMCRNADTMGL